MVKENRAQKRADGTVLSTGRAHMCACARQYKVIQIDFGGGGARHGVAVPRCRSGDGRVSEETRQRVLQTTDRLRYQINQIARSMNRRKSDLIGLVTFGLEDPFRI
jgi:hypothetical protein